VSATVVRAIRPASRLARGLSAGEDDGVNSQNTRLTVAEVVLNGEQTRSPFRCVQRHVAAEARRLAPLTTEDAAARAALVRPSRPISGSIT
jgi:hypothetical protein